jgi:15-cis-phytoene synthase / lycopene beta-cyclase
MLLFSHVKFTIPLAGLLTLLAYPLLTRLDVVRVLFITVIAFVATIPWDSYLIRTNVWTYPQSAVLGLTLFGIPIEELFFFAIQTYITSSLYILLNKPVLHPAYLTSPKTVPSWIKRTKILGQLVLIGFTVAGAFMVAHNGKGTYLGLILTWVSPFALFTWTLAGEFVLALPWTCTILPIWLPTIYLWVVDEMSLRRGTWNIQSGTKLGLQVFGSLELEEAVFFLATNTLIVMGVAAFDQAVAVFDAFPAMFPKSSKSSLPPLIQARILPASKYDMSRISAIKDAVARLQKKSRSFYLASSVFPGRLRVDMVLL